MSGIFLSPARPGSASLRFAVPLLALATLIACSEPDEPLGPGLHLVSGAGQSDTIATTLPQPLVMEVVPAEGIRPGVLVLFEAVAPVGAASVRVAPLSAPDAFIGAVSVPTDERGRAVVRVRLGQQAGTAQVRVSVPEYGYEASIPFDITAGRAAGIIVAPQDTLVEVGATFASRSWVVDRVGNPRADALTLGAPSSNVSVSGNQITVTGAGRSTLAVRSGQLQAVMRVFAGILADVTGLTSTRLVHFNPDGTIALEVERSVLAYPYTADWSPDGRLLAADQPGLGAMQIMTADGETRLVGGDPGMWPLYPEFSPDGEWIYYSRSDQGWHIRRMRPDGSGDAAVPGIPSNRVAPSLSPDGRFIALVHLGPDRLEVFEVATGTLREIALGAHTPAWSPDGARIAFVSPNNGQLEVIHPDGSNRRVISPPGMRFLLGIDWTPEGALVVGHEQLTGDLTAVSPGSPATIAYRFPGIGAPATRRPGGS